jgi:hypothetical protein
MLRKRCIYVSMLFMYAKSVCQCCLRALMYVCMYACLLMHARMEHGCISPMVVCVKHACMCICSQTEVCYVQQGMYVHVNYVYTSIMSGTVLLCIRMHAACL